jgi:hypothetical protein
LIFEKRIKIWQYLDWNNGMLDYWNDGLKETSIQNAYYFIDFLVLMAYFSGKNQKIDAY